MKFKKLSIDDIPLLKKKLEGYSGRVCDYSAGNLVFWRDLYETEFYSYTDGFAVKFGNMEGKVCYWCGTNNSLIEKIIALEGGCARFTCLTKDETEYFSQNYLCSDIHHSRNWDDYIYNAEDISELKGKRYCGQRNHINKFNKLYESAVFEKITAKNAEKVKSFCHEYFHALGRERAAVAEYEERYLSEQLDNIEKYGQNTLALLCEGKVIGFSIGEIVHDTLIIHTENADTRYDGVYPVIVREFARRYAGGVSYINREEDCGEEGLRTSKLSYHPVEILEKYSLVAKIKEL